MTYTYRNILVHIDNSPRRQTRIDLAIQMTSEFGAHLTGLYLVYQQMSYPYGPEVMLEGLVAEQERLMKQKRDAAEQAFTESARRAGLTVEWRAPAGNAANVAPVHARYADLTLVGQSDPDDPETFVAEGFPELLVLSAGRPVLFVPYAGPVPGRFGTVLVAWNGSREGTRAVTDALPLLQRADKVYVVSVNPKIGEREHGEVPGADIALYLARHGVAAEVTQVKGADIDAGELLLSQAADLGADLIVTGAYGHARFREVILGGVTRTLLKHMTVPVFMSH